MESEELLHISFNQATTLLTQGSHHGFKVFRLNPLELLNHESKGNFKIVEMYESSQLLILVGAGEQPAFSPRRLTIWNLPEGAPICETSFPDSVLSVQMNRIRMVAVLSDSIYIYNTITMKTQHILRTAENPKGLVALSSNSESCFLLYPASEQTGHLHVYDCFSMQPRSVIEAHNSPLAFIAISYQGGYCATASVKGTIIRVFSLPEGNKMFTFKRGIVQAEIYGLMFAIDYELLLACSSTGTIHIYDISHNKISQATGWGSSLKQSLINTASYILPEHYKDSFETNRSFITAKTHFRKKFIAAIIAHSDLLIAVSYSQEFIIYRINVDEGGMASIVQHGILNGIILNQIKIKQDEDRDIDHL